MSLRWSLENYALTFYKYSAPLELYIVYFKLALSALKFVPFSGK